MITDNILERPRTFSLGGEPPLQKGVKSFHKHLKQTTEKEKIQILGQDGKFSLNFQLEGVW